MAKQQRRYTREFKAIEEELRQLRAENNGLRAERDNSIKASAFFFTEFHEQVSDIVQAAANHGFSLPLSVTAVSSNGGMFFVRLTPTGKDRLTTEYLPGHLVDHVAFPITVTVVDAEGKSGHVAIARSGEGITFRGNQTSLLIPGGGALLPHSLKSDQMHASEVCHMFRILGLLPLLEELDRSFQLILEEACPKYGFNLSKRTPAVGEPPLDLNNGILSVLMLQSAHHQFVHAVGHVMRRHAYGMYASLRTMVENAGVARLSLKGGEIGELFVKARDDLAKKKQYKEMTKKSCIFPDNDPITEELVKRYDEASGMFHSNLVSLVGRLRHEVDEKGLSIIFGFYDTPSEDQSTLVSPTISLAETTLDVLRLFVESFGITGGEADNNLQETQREFDRLLKELSLPCPGAESQR
jgi:hypothetical protein